ncbi:hypothetical protein ACC677_38260, partial [Rhizobium ruizarguesonis]
KKRGEREREKGEGGREGEEKGGREKEREGGRGKGGGGGKGGGEGGGRKGETGREKNNSGTPKSSARAVWLYFRFL